jgi:hypothetical protein
LQFAVGLKLKGKAEHVIVDAEDALIAALKTLIESGVGKSRASYDKATQYAKDNLKTAEIEFQAHAPRPSIP